MSQAGELNSGAGPVPPTVPTSFVTNVNSPAIPAANVLNVFGGTTNANNNNGIRSDGSSGSNVLTVQLTNRLQGTTSTVGATSSPIISFTPSAVGTYAIEFRIAAYNSTSTLGAGYSIFGSVRFDGVNSNLCGISDKIVNEEGLMSNANCILSVSGATILLTGVGYIGQNIDWSAVGLYTYVG